MNILNCIHYTIIFLTFLSGVSKNFANNKRTKSPRPPRIPLPIPAGVSNTGMNYVSEKSTTLKELMRIKDICRSHLSDHYMITARAIHYFGIKSMVQPLKYILVQYQVKIVPL